jgi:hypothetical protein
MENLIHVSFGFILEQLDLSNSGIVYVRVQTAEVVNGSLNEAFVAFFLGCIAGYRYDLAFVSLSVQFFNGFLAGFFIAVGDYDIVAVLKQLIVMPRPIPRSPPVTTATRFSSVISLPPILQTKYVTSSSYH